MPSPQDQGQELILAKQVLQARPRSQLLKSDNVRSATFLVGESLPCAVTETEMMIILKVQSENQTIKDKVRIIL